MMKHVVGHFVHIALLLKQVGLVSRLLVRSEDWGQSGARPPQPPLPAPHTSTPQRPTSSDPHHHLCHPANDWLPHPCSFCYWTSESNINNEHGLKVIFCFQFSSGAIMSSADETLRFTEAVASLCPPWPWRSSPLASLITAS